MQSVYGKSILVNLRGVSENDEDVKENNTGQGRKDKAIEFVMEREGKEKIGSNKVVAVSLCK